MYIRLSTKMNTFSSAVRDNSENPTEELPASIINQTVKKYKLIILITNLLLNFNVMLICLSYGRLLPELLDEYPETKTAIFWAGSLASALPEMLSYPTLLIYRRTGFIKTSTCAIMALTLGVVLFVTIDKVYMVIIGYGILAGLGTALYTNALTYKTAKMFPYDDPHHTLTTGLVASVYPVTFVIGAPLTDHLIQMFGWRVTIGSYVSGCALLAVMAFCATHKAHKQCQRSMPIVCDDITDRDRLPTVSYKCTIHTVTLQDNQPQTGITYNYTDPTHLPQHNSHQTSLTSLTDSDSQQNVRLQTRNPTDSLQANNQLIDMADTDHTDSSQASQSKTGTAYKCTGKLALAIMWALITFTMMPSLKCIYIIIIKHAKVLGIDEQDGSILQMITAGTTISISVALLLLGDRFIKGKFLLMYAIVLPPVIAINILVASWTQYWQLVLYSVINGITGGMCFPFLYSASSELMGKKYAKEFFSIALFSVGLGNIFVVVMSGYIFDSNGSFENSFYLNAGLLGVSLVLLFVLCLMKKFSVKPNVFNFNISVQI